MKITVCIGSSCHIKGSRQVVETLNRDDWRRHFHFEIKRYE